ncbi:hypothetical protein GCM10020254_34210 [Streptomyces goshikiensis]
MMSYCAETSESFWTVAPLLKFCQYPVRACLGTDGLGFGLPPPVVVPVTGADLGPSPAALYALTWKAYEVAGASPVIWAEAEDTVWTRTPSW